MTDNAEAPPSVLELTADIIANFVGANAVSAADLPGVISMVYDALHGLGAPSPVDVVVETPKKLTAAQIRKSITPDGLTCFACGRSFKTLRRHIRAEHGFAPGEYVVAYGLPRDYPMVAETTSALRRITAMASGLGRKAPPAPVKPPPKNRRPKAASATS